MSPARFQTEMTMIDMRRSRCTDFRASFQRRFLSRTRVVCPASANTSRPVFPLLTSLNLLHSTCQIASASFRPLDLIGSHDHV